MNLNCILNWGIREKLQSVVLKGFFVPETGLFRADYRPKLTIPCFVVGIQWQMLAVSRVEC